MSNESGQSLIEIMIGLAVGAIVIGTASLTVAFMLRSSQGSQRLQSASGLELDLLNKVRSVANANWYDVYDLTKGTSTQYYVSASGTQAIVVQGKEGFIDNDVPNSLVGHWKLDEATGTTAYDATGNNSNGTVSGATLSTSCKVSDCRDFDGIDDYVQRSDNATLSVTSTITFAAWVKRDTTGAEVVAAKWNSTGNQRSYELRFNSSNRPQFFVSSNGTATSSTPDSGVAVTDTNWHHVAGVYDGSNIKVYLDGTEYGSASYGSGIYDSTANFRIGADDDGTSGEFFDGKIDEVRIYNRALSAEEVNRLVTSTSFTRYFSVENVSRNSSGDITSSGGTDDPSTQKVTATIEWSGSTSVNNIVAQDYVTRWRNAVFRQTDWSGGQGESGVISDPYDKFATSSEVGTSTGSIRIRGL